MCFISLTFGAEKEMMGKQEMRTEDNRKKKKERRKDGRISNSSNTKSPLTPCSCHAMAQAVSHRPLTPEARLPAWVIARETCGAQSGTGTDFYLSSLVFPCQYHSTMALISGG
jgi:hypothetical protein